MKRVIISIVAVALAGVCSAEEQKIKLTYCTDSAIAQIVGSHRWVNCGNDIKVCGKVFRINTKSQNGVFTLGIDMDDDGKISSKEVTSFPYDKFKPFIATFKVNVAGEERNVPIFIYNAWLSKNKEQIHLNYRSAWAMSAKINGQTVYFINNPHNAAFSVDNTFYATKAMPYGAPFRANICVNGKFYEAAFDKDGTEITLNEKDQSDGFGKFSFKSSMKNCQSLILANDEWSFDLMDSAINVVPATTLEVRTCVYEKKGSCLKNGSSKDQENVKMTFKSDNENIISFGAPFTYYVKATLNDDTVRVEPTNTVMGSGGEIYSYEGPTSKIPPTVMIYIGKKCISKGKMPFGNGGGLFRYTRKVSGISEANGSVAVMRLFPGIGPLKGVVNFPKANTLNCPKTIL